MLRGFFMKEDPILFYRLGKVSHDVDLTDSSLETINLSMPDAYLSLI